MTSEEIDQTSSGEQRASSQRVLEYKLRQEALNNIQQQEPYPNPSQPHDGPRSPYDHMVTAGPNETSETARQRAHDKMVNMLSSLS